MYHLSIKTFLMEDGKLLVRKVLACVCVRSLRAWADAIAADMTSPTININLHSCLKLIKIHNVRCHTTGSRIMFF